MEHPKFAYFGGKIVPYSEAKVGVLTHALNYGTAAFGGMRAYWNADQEELNIFRPIDHFRRFLNSSRLLMMDFDHTPEELTRITIELLQAEGYRRNIYIRPLAFKADESIGVKLHGLRDELSIVAVPFERYVSNDTNAHVTFSSWRRWDDNRYPARKDLKAPTPIQFVKSERSWRGSMKPWCSTRTGMCLRAAQ
jgi:branched-chain amino acid aminotransferase